VLGWERKGEKSPVKKSWEGEWGDRDWPERGGRRDGRGWGGGGRGRGGWREYPDAETGQGAAGVAGYDGVGWEEWILCLGSLSLSLSSLNQSIDFSLSLSLSLSLVFLALCLSSLSVSLSLKRGEGSGILH
jgi:hypothetical protein